MEQYVFLVFLLILALILVAPASNAGGVIAALGNTATNQIVTLQGRSSSTSVLGSIY